MITCIRFWVGLVVPYKVTMVTHTHFEECTKFHTFSTKMCSVSGVPFGWHEAAPCAPAVRSCSRSYQPNAPLVLQGRHGKFQRMFDHTHASTSVHSRVPYDACTVRLHRFLRQNPMDFNPWNPLPSIPK